jgi:CRISPR-associated endonuclease Csy4
MGKVMKYYQDITLLPDDKNNFGVLLQKVYQQIHIALADNKVEENISEISVSFPKYCNQSLALGNRIRLVAPQKLNLDELNIY